MFKDLGILSILHKGVNHDALAITAREGLTIATKNGGLAIGRPDIGEIKEGNMADLVILNLDRPNMQPINNPVSAIAYSANGSEVETVMVGGKLLMENREFKTIDAEEVYYEVKKISKRINA
jgi:5-methylthioadenosine/S-adenosylhomocysteine deaminase